MNFPKITIPHNATSQTYINVVGCNDHMRLEIFHTWPTPNEIFLEVCMEPTHAYALHRQIGEWLFKKMGEDVQFLEEDYDSAMQEGEIA